jgi:hypothetical protein
MQTTITVIAQTETVSVKWTELGNVTLNVIENDYDKSVILSYDTLLKLAIAIVENHNKPITIAELDKQGLI